MEAISWLQRQQWRLQQSGRFMIFIIYFSIFLDNMLLTIIVPIVPDILQKNEESKERFLEYSNNNGRNGGIENLTELNISALQSPFDKYHCNLNWPWFPFSSRKTLSELEGKVGLLFASKAMVQLVANPLVGTMTNRIGYTTPLFFGSLILLASSLLFSLGTSYEILFLARSVQGIGSACISIAGMAAVADRYHDDKERSKMMGITLSGIALGVLIGYPFGGMMYDFVGKTAPMLFVAFLISINTVLQAIFLRPRLEAERLLVGTGIMKLIGDPYILLTSGAICVSTLSIASMEPCLPMWLMSKMSPPMWQLGTVFIPDSVGYLLGTNLFGIVAIKIQRWLTAMMSMLLVGVCAILIPLSTKMSHLFIPHFGLGLGIGITDAALMPLLAYLVDIHYIALYGTVYAVAQMSVSTAYCIGPVFGSQLVKVIGFPWLMWSIGILNIIYCPLCYFLRNAKPNEELKAINLNSAPENDSVVSKTEGRIAYSSFVDEN